MFSDFLTECAAQKANAVLSTGDEGVFQMRTFESAPKIAVAA